MPRSVSRPWSVLNAALVCVSVLSAVLLLAMTLPLLLGDSPQHDKDLRAFRQRYPASPYAAAEHRAYQSAMVEACMRGRGY